MAFDLKSKEYLNRIAVLRLRKRSRSHEKIRRDDCAALCSWAMVSVSLRGLRGNQYMSIKTYKILLWGLTLAWAAVSFVFFGNKLLRQTTFTEAKNSVEYTQSFFEEYSKQIKFKLGQWSYNYQLKSHKGVEFDHAAFMDAEFDLIGFYAFNADEEKTPYEKQWLKSKDFAANELPENLIERIQGVSYESVVQMPYLWMAGLDSSGQSVVLILSAVDDVAIGKGVLVGVLDLEMVPYSKLNPNALVVDSQGRYLMHPQKEYLAQRASATIKQIPEGELYSFEGENWLLSKKNGYDYVYRAEKKDLISLAGLPMVLMLLGLGFLVALPMLLQDEPEPFEDVTSYEPKTAEQSDIDFAGYESVLKVQSLREKLNKMTLISSSLKGRLDLASLGEVDQKLLKDIISDFRTLDKSIDDAFNEASEFGGQEDVDVMSATSSTSSVSQVVVPPVMTEQGFSLPDMPASTIEAKESTKKDTKAKEQKTAAPATEAFAFEIQEEDIDIDFAQNLSLTPVTGNDAPATSAVSAAAPAESVSSSSVIKVPAAQYSSTLVSESLEEAKSAFGSFANDADILDDEDLFADLNDLDDIEVVSDETEIKVQAQSSTKNDWSKVIEELTEELNNLDLDLSEIEMEETETAFEDDKKAAETAAAITPPRVEL